MPRTWFVAGAALMLIGAGPSRPERVDMDRRILPPPALPAESVKPFVKTAGETVALLHIRIIDGTGAAPLEDRTLIIQKGRIAAILPSAGAAVPAGATVLDLTGRTIMPGIVGMHDHQYYIARPNLTAHGRGDEPLLVPEMLFSSPRLYLAAGVTTLRTTGSVEPYADLNLKRLIDKGQLPGPHMDVTAPYLEGANSYFIQMHQLTGPDDARRTVAFWAEQGATSFKAYMNITRAELAAAIGEAHRRGLKVTGHLCSITYPEAARLGIDNLEHGFFVNTQLDPDKKPDQCSASAGEATLERMDANGPEAADLIKLLVASKVAVTSTLPVFEPGSATYRPLGPKALDVLSPEARNDYFYLRNAFSLMPATAREQRARHYANAARLELSFARAGGLLLAGPDPTGAGNVIPGFGDQRAIELLVDAGFTPLEAIRIGTLNGAVYLGLSDRIGSIEVGKNADLVVVNGNPAERINDIERVETVFKDGIAYDSAALLASVKGRYGRY